MTDAALSMSGMLADSAASFVARKYGFARRNQRLTEDLGPDSALWKEFAELGWLACLVPEEHGGLGGGAQEMAALMEVFGAALMVEPVLSSAVFATRLLAAVGSPASGYLLSRMAAGEYQVAIAYAEAGARTGIAGIATSLATGPAGSLLLSGRKIVVLGAPTAERLVVSARFGDSDRLSLLLVDPGAPGVATTRYRTIDGREAADVTFSNVNLAASALLSHDGGCALSLALDWAAIAACAELLGCMEETIRISAEYARTRHQFGQPIGSFQSIKHLLAAMATQRLLARAMLARGVEALGETDDIRRARMVSAARNCIARAADCVTANGIQVHGGIGMTEEYVVGHHYKRVLVLSELFGSAEFHRERFARLTRATDDETSFPQSGHPDAV